MTAPALDRSTLEGLDLVRRHQAGDPAAFAEIYRTHYDTVMHFVLWRVKDRQLAEDLAQETFTKAFSRIGRFEVRDRAIGAWLVTIARNLVADYFKSKSFQLSRAFDSVPEHSADRLIASHAPAADEQVLGDLDRADLLMLMQDLTGHQRDVIELRFFRGLSVAETSEVLDVSVAAAKTLQFRAVQSLARFMRERDEDWSKGRSVPGQRQAS